MTAKTATPTPGKPVWLLDVDGVLNANKPGWGMAPAAGMAYSGGDPYRIRWAPDLANRIRRLHAAGTVEVRWCTTWCPDADQIERLLGLPPFTRAWNTDLRGYYAREAKRNAAWQVMAEGRRLVWTDDEAIPRGTERRELEAYGALLIEPSPRRGLQPKHLDIIEAFLANDGHWCCGGDDCAGLCGEAAS